MTRICSLMALCAVALAAAGCDGSPTPSPITTDAQVDLGPDAQLDAALDATLDAALDAQADVALDAEVDSAGPDAAQDATLDAAQDAEPDAEPDAELDAEPDQGTDAAIEGTPPTISLATAYPIDGVLALRVDGQDEAADAIELVVELLNDRGEAIPLNPVTQDTRAIFQVTDFTAGQAEFTIRLWIDALESFPDAVGVRLHLRDDEGADGPGVDRAFAERPVVATGAPCNPMGIDDTCVDDSFCGFGDEGGVPRPGDGALPDAGVCVLATAPIVDEALAVRAPEGVHFVVSGHDDTADVTGLSIQRLNADGEPIAEGAHTIGLLERVAGALVFEARALLPGAYPDTTMVQLRLLDHAGLQSAPVTLPLTPQHTVAAGERCDPTGVDPICAQATPCVAGDDQIHRCVVSEAVQLNAVTAFYNPATRALGVELSGQAEVAPVAFELTLLDADGAAILVDGRGTITYNLASVQHVGDAFSAIHAMVLPAEVPAPGGVRIVVIGAEEARSGAVEGAINAPRVTAPGGVCDPLGALSVCDEAHACHDADAVGPQESTCVPAVDACPEGWPLVDLLAEDGGPWQADGDTTGFAATDGGQCGGGAGASIYRFVAPGAGRFMAETTSADANADTVVYARRLCGVYGLTNELACNDDRAQGEYLSVIEWSAEAGDTAYLFVDGYQGPFDSWQGPFTLSVQRLPD